MSKYQWISIMGLWVMCFLFLGFPAAWDKGIAMVSGLIIIILAYRGGVALRAHSQKPPAVPVPPTATPSQSIFAQNDERI